MEINVDRWHSCLSWMEEPAVGPMRLLVLLQTMNQQYATIPCHKDTSSKSVARAVTIQQSRSCSSNTKVLDLSKYTFQHLLKLQEPSVSFTLASPSFKKSLEQWKQQGKGYLLWREHVGTLALSVISPMGTIGGKCQEALVCPCLVSRLSLPIQPDWGSYLASLSSTWPGQQPLL